MSGQKKPWPPLRSDGEAETFVAKADLAAYDWTVMQPVTHEFGREDASIHRRLPESRLDGVTSGVASSAPSRRSQTPEPG
jgi:predicted DNA binding CopG/RHH family protein